MGHPFIPELAFITTDTMADTSFQKEFLETHNTYRAKHNTPPLRFSSELNSSAQKWADHLLAIGSLQHSGSMEYGENIYLKRGTATMTVLGREAVDSWYNEIKNYNWSRPGYMSNIGHFTQVVWKESTELGVGMATDGKTVFVVGQYRPTGNMMGAEHFAENVLPLA
ncbi:Golgi-associated plant pathogenesis-related protein 1-like [Epinephelus lanceolatus]|uniref:Golgi-associated plant pathogenesis-related protein 1-like n=1 Tax=Epinephelus lanceolatus TaxID=310571 RepID=UPI0014452A28|nr:Golgi-associated plant pathogenesis-related protein 1-like [Epinephelus lanceolatus]XP_033476506.1 Golgi-associated plant pathogenesis-related protein 1-like [Epinephelus lanceolatus]